MFNNIAFNKITRAIRSDKLGINYCGQAHMSQKHCTCFPSFAWKGKDLFWENSWDSKGDIAAKVGIESDFAEFKSWRHKVGLSTN